MRSLILALGMSAISALAHAAPQTHPPLARGAEFTRTFTYLRCYYRESSDAARPKTDYVWARDAGGSEYYRLDGHWSVDGMFAWANMFYTDTSQDEMAAVCRRSLKSAGIASPYAFHAAADSALSFDYTAWTQADPNGNGMERLVAFGDSLSDTRNMFNASLWKLPNPASWMHGHFSNGEIWVEKLAAALGLPLYNWAVGGAAAEQYLVLPGLVQQVASWKTYRHLDGGYRPESTVFTLLIGGNDLVNYGKSVDEIVTSENEALEMLIQEGAKHILLLGLPDVSRAPVFRRRQDGARVAIQVGEYNRRLGELRERLALKYQNMVDIRLFDTAAVFNDLLTHPANYGMDNVADACLDIAKPSALTYLESFTVAAACRDPDRYVFWDTLHPTRRTHALLAEHILPLVADWRHR